MNISETSVDVSSNSSDCSSVRTVAGSCSGVSSSSAGYMWGLSRGVVIEDGLMLRAQWQINL